MHLRSVLTDIEGIENNSDHGVYRHAQSDTEECIVQRVHRHAAIRLGPYSGITRSAAKTGVGAPPGCRIRSEALLVETDVDVGLEGGVTQPRGLPDETRCAAGLGKDAGQRLGSKFLGLSTPLEQKGWLTMVTAMRATMVAKPNQTC